MDSTLETRNILLTEMKSSQNSQLEYRFEVDNAFGGMRCADIEESNDETALKGFEGEDVKSSSNMNGSVHEHRNNSELTVLYNTFNDFYKVGYLTYYNDDPEETKGLPYKHLPLFARIVNAPEIEWGYATCLKWDYCVRSPVETKNFIRYPLYGDRSMHKREILANNNSEDSETKIYTPLENVDTLNDSDIVYLQNHSEWKKINQQKDVTLLKFFVNMTMIDDENEKEILNNARFYTSRTEINPPPKFKFNINVESATYSEGTYDLTYEWIEGSDEHVKFPPGKYDLALINRVLHSYMDRKKHYFKTSDETKVYMMEFEANGADDVHLNHKEGYVFLKLRSIRDLIEEYKQEGFDVQSAANIFVRCKSMSEKLRKTLGFPATGNVFPTIVGDSHSSLAKKVEGQERPSDFVCYASNKQRLRDLLRYVKYVSSAGIREKVTDITFRSESKGEDDDEPGQKWFTKSTVRLRELPQMKSLAEKLTSNFHNDDANLQDKYSLYEEVTKIRFDVMKIYILTQKKWDIIRRLTSYSKVGSYRCKDGDTFTVSHPTRSTENCITIKGKHKFALFEGGRGRDEQLYNILVFISSCKAIIFNDVISAILIAFYSWNIHVHGVSYVNLRTLLGICVIFFWIPHFLSICVANHFYGHSKREFVRSFSPILEFLQRLTGKEEDEASNFLPKRDIDMEHTLPLILPQRRVKRGVMGCYHLCNAILLYNFAINMIDRHRATAQSEKQNTSCGVRLVDEIMLSRVLLRAEPQLFNRFMKFAMYISMISIPITICLNVYQYSFERHTTEINVALFILWLWYSPYVIACATHAIALFCFTLHAHTLDTEMFIERLNADRLITSSGKGSADIDCQWFRQKAFLEEYLFHQLLVEKSSGVWELSLSMSLICSMALFILGIATVGSLRSENAAVVNDVASWNSLLFMILGLAGFISVFHSVAMLNSRLKKPILAVKEASSSDWNQLADKNTGDQAGGAVSVGGRERLLDYFQSNPIAFKIYGIEITFQAYVIVGSSMCSVFLVMLTIYFGNHPQERN